MDAYLALSQGIHCAKCKKLRSCMIDFMCTYSATESEWS